MSGLGWGWMLAVGIALVTVVAALAAVEVELKPRKPISRPERFGRRAALAAFALITLAFWAGGLNFDERGAPLAFWVFLSSTGTLLAYAAVKDCTLEDRS